MVMQRAQKTGRKAKRPNFKATPNDSAPLFLEVLRFLSSAEKKWANPSLSKIYRTTYVCGQEGKGRLSPNFPPLPAAVGVNPRSNFFFCFSSQISFQGRPPNHESLFLASWKNWIWFTDLLFMPSYFAMIAPRYKSRAQSYEGIVTRKYTQWH